MIRNEYVDYDVKNDLINIIKIKEQLKLADTEFGRNNQPSEIFRIMFRESLQMKNQIYFFDQQLVKY